jgi:sodium-dependent dicarboxylate transporter 2/3/5
MDGPLGMPGWSAILLFILTIFGWIAFSEQLGLGIVAIAGAVAFLVAGLVRWEDINSGVNWGVVLLYAAAISLGVEMKETGAAEWVAQTFIGALAPFGAGHGVGLYAAVAVLTTFVTNTMTAGAAVAVLGPIVLKTATVAGDDPLTIGFITAIASAFAYITAAAHPAFTIIYASGYLKASDFFKSGIRMTFVSLLLILGAATFYWPLIAR